VTLSINTVRGEPDRDEWLCYTREHDWAAVYHSPQFADCLRNAGIPCYVIQARREGRLAGLAVVVEDRLLPLPFLGAKGFCPAGLLADGEREHRALLEALESLLRGRMLYLEVFDRARVFDRIRAEFDYLHDRHRNFLIDLGAGLEAVRSGYSRAIRRNIARAQQYELRCRLATCSHDVRVAWQLLFETSRRVGAPVLPYPLLRAVHRQMVPCDMARIYLGELLVEGSWTAVNARVELLYKGWAIDWYTGSSVPFINTQVGPWLVDKVIEDCCSLDCHTFDFGGGGRVGENYGPAEFKRRFGGTEIEVTRYQRVYHPMLMQLARSGYRWVSRLLALRSESTA